MKDTIKKNSEIRVNIRIPENEKKELKRIAKKAKVTETLIVRHALKQTLSDMKARLERGDGVAIVL